MTTPSIRRLLTSAGFTMAAFHLGKLPVNTQLSAYYNVVRPDDAANWQIRFQVQLMFPK